MTPVKTKSDFKFANSDFDLVILLEVDYENNGYLVVIYHADQTVEIDMILGNSELDRDIAVVDLYKEALKFAKHELSLHNNN